MTRRVDYVPTTSPDAVRDATGRDWDAWFAALDAAGAERLSHKEIVAWLRDEAGLADGWWQQNVTVEYEKARGRRAAVGETADGTFQVGASRTLDLPPEEAWALLAAPPGRDLWLGGTDAPALEEGARFRTADGVEGEVRVVRPGHRLRLRWRPAAWERPSTLQLTVTPKGDRSTIGFHHERLPDAEARQAMRAHWRGVLDALGEAVRARRAGEGGAG